MEVLYCDALSEFIQRANCNYSIWKQFLAGKSYMKRKMEIEPILVPDDYNHLKVNLALYSWMSLYGSLKYEIIPCSRGLTGMIPVS